ncbi:hypothetical protein [Burkholderia sp. LMG 32019]|uniref:hypothetical protein n=1 Tax=Burkholderia sp. LMG 32019 TaxID=3158173 RepID=UPI003C2C2566
MTHAAFRKYAPFIAHFRRTSCIVRHYNFTCRQNDIGWAPTEGVRYVLGPPLDLIAIVVNSGWLDV